METETNKLTIINDSELEEYLTTNVDLTKYDFVYVAMGAAIHEVNNYSTFHVCPEFFRYNIVLNTLFIIYDKNTKLTIDYINYLFKTRGNENIFHYLYVNIDDETNLNNLSKFIDIIQTKMENFSSDKWMFCNYIDYETGNNQEKIHYRKLQCILKEKFDKPKIPNFFQWKYFLIFNHLAIMSNHSSKFLFIGHDIKNFEIETDSNTIYVWSTLNELLDFYNDLFKRNINTIQRYSYTINFKIDCPEKKGGTRRKKQKISRRKYKTKRR